MMKDKKQQDKSPKTKQQKEKLNTKDIEELMGVNMDRYTRGRGGAIRRKWLGLSCLSTPK